MHLAPRPSSGGRVVLNGVLDVPLGVRFGMLGLGIEVGFFRHLLKSVEVRLAHGQHSQSVSTVYRWEGSANYLAVSGERRATVWDLV